jgi:hypothetical protein
MISAVTGEVVFENGLHFGPHEELQDTHLRDARSHVMLPMPGWTHHALGFHPSSFGRFEVEAVTDRHSRIQVVMVSWTPIQADGQQSEISLDVSRRSAHEAVIQTDLKGQEEFSWGEVFCRLGPASDKDWLMVTYADGPHVSLRRPHVPMSLSEHAAEPERLAQ